MRAIATRRSVAGLMTAWVLGLGAVVTTIPACGDGSSDEARAMGAVDLALTGSSASGRTYRLRDGSIAITGTASTNLTTEDFLDQNVISLELPAGGYLAALASGWRLEVRAEDGTWTVTPAVLTSTNPLPFVVVDQAVTDVTLTFRAGDDVVQLGNGRVHIGIAVDDGVVPGATCADTCLIAEALGCAQPEYCTIICEDLAGAIGPACAPVADAYSACAAGVPGDEYVCSVDGFPIAGPCQPLFDEVIACGTGTGCTEDADGDGSCVEVDCDDSDPTISPGALEVCEDGIDQNCDGADTACAPAGWTCPAQFFGVGDGCDCGCGIVDADCVDASAAACDFCNDPGSCSEGLECPGLISATNNATCG